MLSQALASHPALPELRSKSSNGNLYSADFPFPCLLSPEDDEQDADDTADDSAGKDQEEDDAFDWFGMDGDVEKLRVASNTTIYATSCPAAMHLV